VRELLVLLFLFHPRALFVLEQAWTEPLIIGGLGLAVWLWHTQRRDIAAAVFGFTLGLKQYLAIITLHFLLLERRPRALFIAIMAGVAAFVPFLLLDAQALWKNGLWLVVGMPFSKAALTAMTAVHRWTGWVPNHLLSGIVGAFAAVAIPFVLRRADPLPRYLLSITGTLFATFFLGAKSFGNYYYLISALVLMVLAVRNQPHRGPAPATIAAGHP
jgi:hypothetical protein